MKPEVSVVLPRFNAEIPDPGSMFIVSKAAKYGARELIRKHLPERGYWEGKDFIFLA